MNFSNDINTLSCPIIFNSATIEITMHNSCYCLELTLCYLSGMPKHSKSRYNFELKFLLSMNCRLRQELKYQSLFGEGAVLQVGKVEPRGA